MISLKPKTASNWLRAHLPWTSGNMLTTQDPEASGKSESLPPNLSEGVGSSQSILSALLLA